MSTPVPALRILSGGPHGEDLEVRRRFAAGDQRALEVLARPHLDQLYTLCLRLTKNPTEAQDLAQDTLIKVMDRCHRYDPERPFRPWLFKVAVNLCKDRVRTVWWKRVIGLTGEPLRTPTPTPERISAANSRDAAVRKALHTLPPMYREALALYHLNDMQYAEMSEVTGVAVPALKQRVRRGSRMLREKIASLYPELAPARR